jgi:DNA (cytosine-5)-methyltransferase 1
MGAIGIGLAAVGYKVLKAYDSWRAAAEMYNHNAPHPVAITCDILTREGLNQIRRDAREVGEVDLLAAGPPCKGFSQIRNGRHALPNPHNQVLLAIPDYVGLLRPRVVLIENVPDLGRHRKGRTLQALIDRLMRPTPRLRYRVEHAVYDAALYGVPQARRRLLILAVREGDGNERLPPPAPDLSPLYAAVRHGRKVPQHLKQYLDRLYDPADLSMTTAQQALSDLPLLGPGEPEIPRAYASNPSSAYQQAIRASDCSILMDTQTPKVRDETKARLAKIPPGGCARDIPSGLLNGLARRHDSAYRRLHPMAPSTALSTKYDCVYHYAVPRALSVREYARLQGIPDYVSFPALIASRRSAYEMIGNSVPPLLVRGILEEIGKSARD